MNAYQQSLKIKRDNYSVMETAEWRGAQRERTKAEKEKKELAVKAEKEKAELKTKALEEKKEMALKLKHKGMSSDEIAELTKLSIKEIQAL